MVKKNEKNTQKNAKCKWSFVQCRYKNLFRIYGDAYANKKREKWQLIETQQEKLKMKKQKNEKKKETTKAKAYESMNKWIVACM